VIVAVTSHADGFGALRRRACATRWQDSAAASYSKPYLNHGIYIIQKVFYVHKLKYVIFTQFGLLIAYFASSVNILLNFNEIRASYGPCVFCTGSGVLGINYTS